VHQQALIETARARAGTDGIERLDRQQRLIARYQVDGQQLPLEVAGEIFGGEFQLDPPGVNRPWSGRLTESAHRGRLALPPCKRLGWGHADPV